MGVERTLFMESELLDLGAKLGCLGFPTKAGLDRIPVVTPLMINVIPLLPSAVR